ncbi:MAG: hypothetical protein F2737_11370 [Actinobacteria bacterium]|uniref:Unannotated protein n=1 Tax=freshwater metagenome TaxID=449393 RepID=A0A6J6ZS97_9ZZZZ|nr:hypothetical protein [Actinomycetota bacterium]
MIPTTEQPATARRTQRRRRNIIISAAAAIIAVTGAVIVIATTTGSGSRSGTLVNGCDTGIYRQCPGHNFSQKTSLAGTSDK